MSASRQFGPPDEWPARARAAAWVSLALLIGEAVALVLDLSGGIRLAIGIALVVSVGFWIGQYLRTPPADGDPGDSS